MENPLLANVHMRYAHLFLVGILSCTANAQITGLKWNRDTIVEKEYQPSFCQDNPEMAGICSDAFSLTGSGSQPIVIDSIYFKVITTGFVSSHAVLKFNQTVLQFAFNISGQTGYPWKFSEYNDSGFPKISINPFQNVVFSSFEIDNCIFSCPLLKSTAQPKLPVTAALIFVSKNKRDTLTLLGLQSRESTHIRRYPKIGIINITPQINDEYRDSNGRLIGSSTIKGKGDPEISFPVNGNSRK